MVGYMSGERSRYEREHGKDCSQRSAVVNGVLEPSAAHPVLSCGPQTAAKWVSLGFLGSQPFAAQQAHGRVSPNRIAPNLASLLLFLPRSRVIEIRLCVSLHPRDAADVSG